MGKFCACMEDCRLTSRLLIRCELQRVVCLAAQSAALAQIRTLDRRQEIPHEGSFCDLMWSDPEDIETWAVSPRGAGWLFGSKVTQEVIFCGPSSPCSRLHLFSLVRAQFNQINRLELICRAHQLVQEGYKFHYPEQSLVTVCFSNAGTSTCEKRSPLIID